MSAPRKNLAHVVSPPLLFLSRLPFSGLSVKEGPLRVSRSSKTKAGRKIPVGTELDLPSPCTAIIKRRIVLVVVDRKNHNAACVYVTLSWWA